MDALEALGNDCTDTKEPRTLGSPIARRAGPVFLAGKDHERYALARVSHRSVVNGKTLAFRPLDGPSTLDDGTRLVLHNLVLDTNIGERAAYHHLVIAAPCAVLIEIGHAHLPFLEIQAGGGCGLDRSGRGDVIGGNRIKEESKYSRRYNVLDGLRCHLDAGKIRWALHVS